MLLLLAAYLFLLASFIATDQSITQKDKAKCIFSNPGNLPCASRKIYSLREITVFQNSVLPLELTVLSMSVVPYHQHFSD